MYCGAGEVRQVAHSSLRLRESAKLGFGSAYGPAAAKGEGKGEKGYTGLAMLPNLVDRIMGGA